MKSVAGLAHMFLGTESHDYPMDGAAILELDPATAGPGFGFGAVREALRTRAPGTPLVEKLARVAPVSTGYLAAYWVTDPDFDVDRHLARATAPAPGDRDALARLTLELSAGMLSRDRPLWKAWFVDGLADGRCALVMRLHHAAFDGTAGMELFARLFDREPRPSRPPAVRSDSVHGEPRPGVASFAARAATDMLRAPLTSARESASLLRALSAGRTAADGEDRGRLFRSSAPDCVFNRTVEDPARSLALLGLPMEAVAEAKDGLGITITDLVLAIVSGGLRTHLLSAGEPVDRPLSAMCPMNVRTDGAGDAGNRFVMMVNRLPVHLDDPAERVAAIAQETALNKRVARAEASVADSAGAVADILSPLLWPVTMQLPDAVVSRMPVLANLQVSSIPGAPFPLYLAGAEVTRMHARTFAQRGSGLFITAMSYNGTLHVDVTSLAELLPEPSRLTALFETELDTLAALGHAATAA